MDGWMETGGLYDLHRILILIYSSSSSSSSSYSTSAGASAPPSSSSSGDSGSPAFLPGRSPNHLGNLDFVRFPQSFSYFSFQSFSSTSEYKTIQPPSYNFRLSSYVLVSVLRSYLEYMRIFGGYLPVRASWSSPNFFAFCLNCIFCLSFNSTRS